MGGERSGGKETEVGREGGRVGGREGGREGYIYIYMHAYRLFALFRCCARHEKKYQNKQHIVSSDLRKLRENISR